MFCGDSCCDLQGTAHREAGQPSTFNLLRELFYSDGNEEDFTGSAAWKEMQEVTSAHRTWCSVMYIRSPLMRKWLGLGNSEAWHQVQVRHDLTLAAFTCLLV